MGEEELTEIELTSIKVDEEKLSKMGSLDGGCYGIDDIGLYHIYYSSKSYLVYFYGNEKKEEMKEDGRFHGECGCNCPDCRAVKENGI